MIKKDVYGLCMECGDVIQHPICSDCLSAGVMSWLEDKLEHRELQGVVSPSLKGMNVRGFWEVQCIICGHRLTSLCTYCFVEEIYGRLKEEGAPREMLEEFIGLLGLSYEHRYYEEAD